MVAPLSLVPLGLAALGIGAAGTQQTLQNLSPDQKLELLKKAGQTLTGTSGIMSMIDFGGEQERGKMLKDPLITKPSEVGADIKEGFTESEGIDQLPPFTEQEEQKVNVEDVGFTESKQKPSDFIMTSEDTKYIKDKNKLDQIFEGQDNLFREGDYGDPSTYFENINVGYGSVPFYEAWEDAYQGGVADLGDPKAASKITNYSDYKEYQKMIQDYFKENVGDEFVTYRLTTEEDAKKFLDKDVKSYKAKSFTMSPSQAISFAYFANEKFMDMDTYQPKDNLVLLEVPIKPEHLVMRGKSGEKEVVAKTNKIDKSDIRVYNPYTGEVVQDATTGFLKDSPLLDLGSESVPTIKIKQDEETETIQPGQYTVKDKEAWLKKREEEFEKENSTVPTKKAKGGFIDKPLYDTKKDIF